MKEQKEAFSGAVSGAVPGADILIESSVPMGKGVASSAALEVATLKAIVAAYQLDFEGTALPILAQRVENEIVNAPCGLMDQLASYFGTKNSLLPIVCQPDLLQNLIEIPANFHFLGIDSGKKHSVAGNPYRDTRTAAFMGLSMIEQWLGASKKDLETPQKLHYKGYLSNISKYDFDLSFLYKLPKRISGAEFIEKYGHSIDAMTDVNPEKMYAVRQATLHPVYENERVKRFAEILQKKTISNYNLQELGELMQASHESYSACGLGSDATDKLVEMAKNYQTKGIIGAKITGGGNGGTVALLAIGKEGLDSAKQIHADYQAFVGHEVVFFE
jgi:galactokinase